MNIKKQKTKREKLPPINKLKKQLWELCRNITLINYDNTCMLCGKKNNENYVNKAGKICKTVLSCHHFIHNDHNSSKYRFSIFNIVPICYTCHIRKIHEQSSYKIINDLIKNVLVKGIISEQQLKEIAEDKDYMSVDCDNRMWLNEQIELRKQELQRLNDYKFIEVEMLKGLEKMK